MDDTPNRFLLLINSFQHESIADYNIEMLQQDKTHPINRRKEKNIVVRNSGCRKLICMHLIEVFVYPGSVKYIMFFHF